MIGLNTGEVVCARAMVRVVPSIRWDADRIAKIHTSPMTFKTGNLDRIEEAAEPHTHPEPNLDAEDVSRQSRRLRILNSDVKTHGYTDGCQRCEYLRQGRTGVAKGVRHNEACREHTYGALRAAGAEKVKRADMADFSRT